MLPNTSREKVVEQDGGSKKYDRVSRTELHSLAPKWRAMASTGGIYGTGMTWSLFSVPYVGKTGSIPGIYGIYVLDYLNIDHQRKCVRSNSWEECY